MCTVLSVCKCVLYCVYVNVYCTTATGWLPNCSWQIYHIIYHITYDTSYHIISYIVYNIIYHISHHIKYRISYISCHIWYITTYIIYHIYHITSYISYHIRYIISYIITSYIINFTCDDIQIVRYTETVALRQKVPCNEGSPDSVTVSVSVCHQLFNVHRRSDSSNKITAAIPTKHQHTA